MAALGRICWDHCRATIYALTLPAANWTPELPRAYNKNVLGMFAGARTRDANVMPRPCEIRFFVFLRALSEP